MKAKALSDSVTHCSDLSVLLLESVGTSGGAQVISPEVPFSMEDLNADHIFYVQNVRQVNVHQDIFSFYISDGSSQTEAFVINIDIQVRGDLMTAVCSFSFCSLFSAWQYSFAELKAKRSKGPIGFAKPANLTVSYNGLFLFLVCLFLLAY